MGGVPKVGGGVQVYVALFWILKMNFAPESDSFISTWLGGEEDFCCFLFPTQPHHNHTPSAPPKTPSSMLFHILTLILFQPANFLGPRNLS